MISPIQLHSGIYLIKIPFEELYTSAFILSEGGNAVIFDSGSNNDDAVRYIIPPVQSLGFAVKYIVLSHAHSDHDGGAKALRYTFPYAVTGKFSPTDVRMTEFSDGDMLFGRFILLNLQGHTPDSMAIFDVKTKALLSADCLQLRGIGKYRNGIGDRAKYRESIEQVRGLHVRHIIASHDYDPLGQFANGEAEVKAYLDECEAAVT